MQWDLHLCAGVDVDTVWHNVLHMSAGSFASAWLCSMYTVDACRSVAHLRVDMRHTQPSDVEHGA